MINIIEKDLFPLREKLKNHKLYSQIKSLNDIQVFTEFHVFAVWDFMSLLKDLQRKLTCINIPWRPKGFPKASRLINEIVWGEESDLDHDGRAMSHFEMYLNAMNQIQSNSSKIKSFLSNWDNKISPTENIEKNELPKFISDFLKFTFEVISLDKEHITAAVFTFGREDLIPEMFIEILKNIKEEDNTNISPLIYYFERHIEVDSDEHGPMALEMVSELCGDNETKWNEAKIYSKRAMEMRIDLWDGIYSMIN
tara:strand:- start:4037 stop:4795 length:759 start_codon:yes stop_codon:yes gene_type:complete